MQWALQADCLVNVWLNDNQLFSMPLPTIVDMESCEFVVHEDGSQRLECRVVFSGQGLPETEHHVAFALHCLDWPVRAAAAHLERFIYRLSLDAQQGQLN